MAVTSWNKGQVGESDIAFDYAGDSEVFIKNDSLGNPYPSRRVNASHLPITTSARGKTLVDATTSTVVNVNAAIAEIYAELLKLLPLAGNRAMTGTLDAGSQLIDNVDAITFDSAATGLAMTNSPITNPSQLSMQSGGSGIDMNSTKVTDMASGTASGDAIHYGQIDDSTIGFNGSNQLIVKDNGVNIDKLDMNGSGGAPAGYTFAQGKVTISGTPTSSVISATGVVATDLVLAQFEVNAGTITIKTAVPTADTVTLNYSAAATNNDVVVWTVFRATST